MSVPAKSNPRWAELLTGKKTYTLKFLAAKIMLGRLARSVQANPSSLPAAIDELHTLFSKNETSAAAQGDLNTIFS